MSSSTVVFALAKVLISAAWSDGRITQERVYGQRDQIEDRRMNIEHWMEIPNALSSMFTHKWSSQWQKDIH